MAGRKKLPALLDYTEAVHVRHPNGATLCGLLHENTLATVCEAWGAWNYGGRCEHLMCLACLARASEARMKDPFKS